jgi:outer membrane protein TolC
MIVRKKLIIRIIASFMLVGASFQTTFADPKELSLDDCVNLALESNPTVKIAEASKEKALWGVKQAEAGKGLQIDLVQEDERTNAPPTWVNALVYPNVPAYNLFVNKVELSLPIYSGGKLETKIKMAKLDQKISIINTETVKQQLILDVTKAYYDALQANNLLQIAGESTADFASHLKNVQAEYDVGTVAMADVLQTKVRLADAQDKQMKAQNSYDLAIYNLNNLLQLPLHSELKLTEAFSMQPYPLSLDDSITLALKNQPELAKAEANLVIAQKQVVLAKSENKPTVSMTANHEWDSEKYPGTEYKNWTIGVTARMNVFDDGMSKSEIKQAESGVEIAAEQVQQQHDTTTLEVSRAYLSMKEAEKRRETNQVAVEHAALDFKLAQERYNAGVGINLDAIDAELALTQARVNYTEALYDYDVNEAQLDKAIGIVVTGR